MPRNRCVYLVMVMGREWDGVDGKFRPVYGTGTPVGVFSSLKAADKFAYEVGEMGPNIFPKVVGWDLNTGTGGEFEIHRMDDGTICTLAPKERRARTR